MVDEVAMILMTRGSLADRAIAEAKALYSHETSTLVALDATGANASFIEWIVICEPAAAQWVVRGGLVISRGPAISTSLCGGFPKATRQLHLCS